MAKVIILTHGSFYDNRTKIRFDEHVVKRGENKSLLGVANVPDDVAREYYEGHEAFEIQYDEPQLSLLQDEPGPDEVTPPSDIEPAPEPEPASFENNEALTVEETTAPAAVVTAEPDEWYTVEQLSKMTVEALKTLAATEDIDVSACKLKDEFINVIVAAGQE